MARKADNPYGVHPSVATVQTWVDSLPAKTGWSLEEWFRLIEESGPPTEKERREWLKAEHGLGTNSAWWLAERAAGKNLKEGDPEAYLASALEYVDAMFAGGKAGLRPIYDRLLELGLALGDDVKACPCQTIVPLYRRHVFAQIKPTTRTRIDLGLCLRNPPLPPPARILETGGLAKGDRITHRIPIGSLAEIDGEVERWMRTAYELDV